MCNPQYMTRRACSKAINNLGFLAGRRHYTPRVVKEHDVVLLKHKTNPNAVSILTAPLRPGRVHQMMMKETIEHDRIIGKRLRDSVKSSRQRVEYRILEPTLAEYTNLSPRLVTPIYSQDADLIVNLLDLHPTVPGNKEASDEKLEIFEAGTGHGSLTIRLARAIHAANTAPPERPQLNSNDLEAKAAYDSWRSTRRAVIHTLDNVEKNSAHAEMVIQDFRGGMYYGNIDFHVGSIKEFISKRLEETSGEPFLHHAILDLPDTHANMEIVSKALKPNGMLLIFCPSVTQINKAVLHVKDNDLPLYVENAIEIGGSIGTGGREWDIRPVKPRAVLKAEAAGKTPSENEGLYEGSEGQDLEVARAQDTSEGWEMICRPRVGARIVGGGFLGIWRKMLY